MPIRVDTSRDDMARVIRVAGRVSRKKDGGLVSEFIQKASDRYRTVVNAEARLRQNMRNDLEFRASEQWDARTKAERASDGRPTLTINRLPAFIRQVTNQMRASRPAVQVNPIDSGSDPKVAEALQGVIRNIETNSNADVAYATAAEFQVTCGRGYWFITTEYASDDNYDQVIKICTIRDPLSVFCDPTYVEPDTMDKRYGFIVDDMPKDTFEERFGAEAAQNYEAWLNSRDRAPEWMPEGKMRIAHYFYLETDYEDVTDIEMPSIDNPSVRETIRIDSKLVPSKDEMPEGWVIKGSREIKHQQCKYALITPVEVLDGNEEKTEGRDFPCEFVPIIPVHGEELNIDGEVDYRGMVRDAKDPQKMYSFWASALTEVIALAPRAPYIGYAGQFKGFETKWQNANRKSYAYLEVNPVTVGGQPAPLPQRQQFEPAIQAIVEAFQLADNDLKAVTGLYDASLGKSGPEQSGKAILARQSQGQLGNSNFMDNWNRAIRMTGRILLNMIPRVYLPAKVFRILGADGQSKNVVIHAGADDRDLEAFRAAEGIQGIYDISAGRYDIAMSEGPDLQSRRQEAVEAMLQLINSYPNAAPMVMDLLVKNSDWPGADEIAARLRRAVPINLLSKDEGGTEIPSQVQQQLDSLQKELQKLQQEKAGKVTDNQGKLAIVREQNASAERRDSSDNEARVMVAELEARIQEQADRVQAQADRMIQEMSARHDALMKQNQHAMDLKQQDEQHQAEMQRNAEQHAQEMAQAKAKHEQDMKLAAQAAAQEANAAPEGE